VREWLARVGVQTLFIAPGSPWENGYIESFNGKPRDELLDREIFYTLAEAKIWIDRWRQEHDTFRPHSALGYRPPAPEAVLWSIPKPIGLPSAATVGLTWKEDETWGRVTWARATVTTSEQASAASETASTTDDLFIGPPSV
jgi:hypothetical protein